MNWKDLFLKMWMDLGESRKNWQSWVETSMKKTLAYKQALAIEYKVSIYWIIQKSVQASYA